MKEILTKQGCYKEHLDDFLGAGIDSMVYKDGGKIHRVYTGSEWNVQQGIEKLSLYWDITNVASARDFYITFPFSKTSFLVNVNKIVSIYRCSTCGHIEAESLYIPGRSLSGLTELFDPIELKIVLQNLSNEFNESLGVGGVELDARNIKLISAKQLMITDLCSNIGNLRKKWW